MRLRIYSYYVELRESQMTLKLYKIGEASDIMVLYWYLYRCASIIKRQKLHHEDMFIM